MAHRNSPSVTTTPAPGQLCECVHTFVEHDEDGCMTCRTIRRDGTAWHVTTREPCHGFRLATTSTVEGSRG
jgi:hypothetical protein